MKKVLFVITAALLITCFAAAQAQDAKYQVNWYAHRNNDVGADAFLRIINTGVVGSPLSPNEGRICANIYAFDDTQEMLECCSCTVTGNGLLTLSLINNIMQNPLTGLPAPETGVIKIVGTVAAPGCDETNLVGQTLTNGLVAWQTQTESPSAHAFVSAITQYAPATLTAQEQAFLGQTCSFVQYLGSGKGVCTCGTGSH
jgi:hypothetical protein